MKKHYSLLFLCLFVGKIAFSQSTSILPGGTYLYNNGTAKALQLPVLHTADISAIVPPTATKGMMIYDCDLKCVKVFNGTDWNCLCQKSEDAPGCSDAQAAGGSSGGTTGPDFPSTDAVAGSGDELFFVGTVVGATYSGGFGNTFGFSGAAGVVALNGGSAGYVAHQNSAGNMDWIKQIGGNNYGIVGSAAVSGITYLSGYVYVVGQFSGQISLTPSGGSATTYTSAGTTDYDFFIAKYDAAGALQWFKQFGDATDQKGISITADNSGNIYALGSNTSNSITFGGLSAFNTTVPKNFIVKFDNSGTPLNIWYAGGGPSGTSTVSPTWVAFSSVTNSIYVVGQFSGSLTVVDGTNNITYTATGNKDIFVQKFTTALAYNALTGFLQFGGTNPSTHILSPNKAVCGQNTVGGTTKATLHIAVNYNGSGILLNGVSLLGGGGGAVLTLNDASTSSIPAFKNIFSLMNTPISSITKNYAAANNAVNYTIPFSFSTMKTGIINFDNTGSMNWVNYTSIVLSYNGNVSGNTIAKGINKVFVTGHLRGSSAGIMITFGSSTLTYGIRDYAFIWQYYNCL